MDFSNENVKIAITPNTEAFIKQRSDDMRLQFVYDIMYSDKLAGIHENRDVVIASEKEGEESETFHLRKASLLDGLQYLRVASPSYMKMSIEKNIANIQKLKMNYQGTENGLPPIKDVWVFIFSINSDEDKDPDLRVNTYFNPNSQDCGDILRTDRTIIMASFVVSYKSMINKEDNNNIEFPDEIYEWTFMSPYTAENLDEFDELATKYEAENLEKMFMLKFDYKAVVEANRKLAKRRD